MKNNSNLEKILKAQGHYQGDLVTLDFKSQTLNKFLQNVVQLVNHHSQRINTLQMQKITTQNVKKNNQKIYQANKIPPILTNQLPGVKIPNRIQSLQDITQGICCNMQLNSQALQFLYDSLKKKDQKIAELQSMMNLFQKAQTSKDNFKKTAQASKKYTDDQLTKVLTRLKQLQMKTNKKIAQFQNTTKQTQKKTLWKINQCQATLLKKITPQYVDKALQQLQAKIHNDIKNNKNQQLNQIKFNQQTQRNKIDTLIKDMEEKQRQNKQWLKDLQEGSKMLEKKQKVQADKRQLQTRIKQLLLKIDRLEKRQDPIDVQVRINKIVFQLKQKSNYHTEKIRKLDSDLDSINNVMSSMSLGDGGGLDPHKLCHIDGQVKRLRDSNRTNQSKIHTLEQQLKTKLLVFQQRIMATLNMLKGQDNFVSRQQMYQSLSRLRQPVTQRLTQNQNLIHQLNGKINKLQLFQKATKRKIKQLTRGDQLNKILDMKMNLGQAQAQFNSINMKLQNLQIILNKTKMEVQANSGFLKDLQDQINQPEEGINIIGPKQKVFPAKCLGCGMKHNPPVYDNSMMMGTDGKYYKVDLKNTYAFDQKQVYGVTPSQIAVYQTTTAAKRHRITNRPTSSRTNLRPNSASRY